MGVSGISTVTFETIVKHLTELEEEKAIILKQYYPEVSSSRDAYEELIQTYIHHVEAYLSRASQDGESVDSCPFVLINSEVEVEDVEEQEVFTLRIVSPFMEKVPMEVECASYLSPMGKALLLRRVNDEVQVKTPVQTLQYKIKRIKLDKIS